MVHYKEGDLLKSECKVLCHQVNCKGVMGSGLALQVANKYPNVYSEYKQLCNSRDTELMGRVQFVECKDNHDIANLFAQYSYGYGKRYTDYEALENCISEVFNYAYEKGYSVAFPKLMGCDRGGGDWKIVLSIILKYFENSNIHCEIIERR